MNDIMWKDKKVNVSKESINNLSPSFRCLANLCQLQLFLYFKTFRTFLFIPNIY